MTTTAGDVELRIPKLRKGSFFLIILEPRRRIDQALYAVVMEAYVHGISTRQVGAFRTRSLDHVEFPYVYLDATYLHVRNAPGKAGQVVSMAVVVATGVTATGERRFWASTSGTARTRSAGGPACSASSNAAWPVCDW